ncbi:MAG: HAD family hydrolase [Clostridia bacterium]|nr:HAD family hydrolase [Clostridia bacterium]
MQYRNYVFDLYGTLIDIHTEESYARRPSLWKTMASLFACHGVRETPEKLAGRFFQIDREERETLSLKLGTAIPESDVEVVFARLLHESQDTFPVTSPISPGCSVRELIDCGFARMVAEVFRIASRTRLRLFPETLDVLRKIRASGARTFLLSNAQSAYTRPELEQLGLPEYLDDIFISSEHGMMKPDPRFLQELMEKHGMHCDDTLMVGDDFHSDGQIALHVGVRCLILDSHGQGMEKMEKNALGICRLGHPEDRERITITSGRISVLEMP